MRSESKTVEEIVEKIVKHGGDSIMKNHYEDWLKVKVEFDGLEVGCKGLCVGWEEPGHDVYPPDGEDESHTYQPN